LEHGLRARGKNSVGRIKILDKDGLVARQQAFAQALGIGVIGKRAHLHGEVSDRGLGPESISMRTGAVPVPIMSSPIAAARAEIQHPVTDEWAAVNDANFNLAAVVQVW